MLSLPPVRSLLTPRSLLGLGLSAIAVLLTLRGVHLDQVAASMGQASLPLVLAATASGLLATVVSTVRWRLLLWPHRGPLGRLTAIFFISQMCNAVLPGKLGAPLRAALTSRVTGSALTFALGSVVIERVLDSALIAALSAALLLLLPVPQAVGNLGRETVLIAVGVLLIIVLAAFFKEQIARPARFVINRLRLPTSAGGMLDALDVLRRRGTYPPLLLSSLLIWFLGVVTNDLMLRALHLSTPWWTAAVLLVALQLGGKLPSSPGNIGVFHYIAVLVLTDIGVDTSLALAYAVILHIAVFIVPAVVGGMCLWWLSLTMGADALIGATALPVTDPALVVEQTPSVDQPRL